MNIRHVLSLFAVLGLVSFSLRAQVTCLLNAHAHNDYEHTKPLYDALSYGFTSVEADIHLIKGKLYVAHDRPLKTSKKILLEEMYLKPLQHLVKKNGGSVYANCDSPFYLMIDIKTEAESTYKALVEILKPYQDMLTFTAGQNHVEGAVTIFLSGNRPIQTVLEEETRLVGIDGRPSDIGKGYSAQFMPVISDNYNNHLRWRGKGEPYLEEEWEKLRLWIEQAHQEGKKVRLWASPDDTLVWERLLGIGVDLLNVDKLELLNLYLLEPDH